MPIHRQHPPEHVPPHERGYFREEPTHVELLELIEKRFEEVQRDLEDIKRKIR